MGCVKSSPIQEHGDFDTGHQSRSQSRTTRSASSSTGNKSRSEHGAEIPQSKPSAVSHKSAGNSQDIFLPANPEELDLTKIDAPTLSRILLDDQKTIKDVPGNSHVPLPFMGPPSDTAEPALSPVSRKSKQAQVIVTSPFDSSVKFTVNNPSDAMFGVSAFHRGREEITPNDTIWPGKRELMPNYKCVKSLDKHALKAPEDLRTNKPEKIVSFLTKVTKNDFQRFRVLFRWVTHAIAYEVRVNDDDCGSSPLEVLQSGEADSCGYSKLLQYLCSLASLTCEVIVGYNKNLQPGKTSFPHAWNRIRLNGRWYLADSAATACPSASSCCPDKFREYEFLADPKYFHSRRLPVPLDRYSDPVPYTSLRQFNLQPTFGALASLCDLQILNHHMGVIRTDENNKLHILMTSSVPMMTWTSLTASTDFKDHREHAVQWWEGNVLHTSIDVPRKGIWDFKVFGQLVCDRDKERNPNDVIPPTVIDTGHCHLVTFTIIARGEGWNPPRMSPDSGMCGSLIAMEQVRPLTHISPFVEAKYGKAVVGFLTSDYRVKMVYRFFSVDNYHRYIHNHVYMERVGDKVMVHVFCPAPGRYVLRLMVNTKGRDYSRQAEYLIQDTGQDGSAYSMTFSQTMGFNVWGPNEAFAEYDLKVISGHTSSTIVATEGEVQLKMRWPTGRDLVLSCCLQDVKKDDRLQGRRVIIHTVNDASKSLSVTNFHIRMRETGYFVLQVYARPKEGTMNKRVGGWLIIVRKASYKPRFPVEGLLCGPNDVFYRLGMRTTASKLQTNDGRGHIDISYDADLERTFRYDVTSSSRHDYDNVITVTNSVIKPHATYVTSFYFDFPEPNVYAIRLMTMGDAYEWSTIGSWIVIYDPSIASPSVKQLVYS